ncbi:MAG: YggT family protein [Thermoleophilia bacterium]|nr:YggT family protein [Thermoleophilia bacterium]
MEPHERHEHVEIDEGGERYEEEDLVAKRNNEINRINGIIWLVFGAIEAIIGIRVILRVLAADPDNAFANFIYQISRLFLMPFFGLVGEPVADGSVLELSSLIGMLIYLLVAWGITRLVYLIMMPSSARRLKTIQRH